MKLQYVAATEIPAQQSLLGSPTPHSRLVIVDEKHAISCETYLEYILSIVNVMHLSSLSP